MDPRVGVTGLAAPARDLAAGFLAPLDARDLRMRARLSLALKLKLWAYALTQHNAGPLPGAAATESADSVAS